VAFTKLARVEEIPPGQTRFFRLPSGPVLLANYEGAIHAVLGICPHQFNPLEGAALWGPLIDCPWHHFQFDCRTGENHFPANVYPEDLRYLKKQLAPLKRYAVEVRDAEIWVDIP
jgi:3-phenylpropionate/trans-cinnamate dioxygenase ferredoxin subunit